MRRLVSCLTVSLLVGCGGGAASARSPETRDAPGYPQRDLFGSCPSGTHWDDCAHGSCEHCDDCVGECMPD